MRIRETPLRVRKGPGINKVLMRKNSNTQLDSSENIISNNGGITIQSNDQLNSKNEGDNSIILFQ